MADTAKSSSPAPSPARSTRRRCRRTCRSRRARSPMPRSARRRRAPRSCTCTRAIPSTGSPTQDPEVLPRVRCRDRAAQRRRAQLHHRRRAPTMTIEERLQPALQLQARGGVAQHGLDELRALPDAEALQRTSSTTGSGRTSRHPTTASSRTRSRTSSTSSTVLRRERHPLRDRVLRHRPPVHGGALPRARRGEAAALHPERVRHPGRHRRRIRTTCCT